MAAQAPIIEAYEGWLEYEQRKQAWILAHPKSTPAEYEAAMLRLARECGV
jgi:hypothetical protein